MKIKFKVNIDTKQDMDEINQLIDILGEFRDKLIALADAEDEEYDD